MSDDPDFCGCGETETELPRPAPRPGLFRIAYRVARHSQHVARMQHGLSRQQVGDDPGAAPPLAGLATRRGDDPTLALIDAWASSLEVLGFYQERIAQEGFLRTATERMSVLELARAIGYELAPGTAATTRLAFTVEEADDPYRETEVPQGTPVMSVPRDPDTLPQTYETLEPITARADWNAIPAQQQRAQPLALYVAEGAVPQLVLIDTDDSIDRDALAPDDYVSIGAAQTEALYPLDPGLDPEAALQDRAASLGEDIGDVTLTALRVRDVYLDGIATGLTPGARMLAVGLRQPDETARAAGTASFVVRTLALVVEEVAPDLAYGVTNVVLRPLAKGEADDVAAPPPPRRTTTLRFRAPRLAVGGLQGQQVALARAPVTALLRNRVWTGANFGLLMQEQSWPRRQVLRLARQNPPTIRPRVTGAPEPGLFALREAVSFFGASAPRQEMLASRDETRGATGSPPVDPYATSWDDPPRPIWTDSQGAGLPPHVDAYLEREVSAVQPDGWLVIEATLPAEDAEADPITQTRVLRVRDAFTEARTDFAISGKVTGLKLALPDGHRFVPQTMDDNFTIRVARANIVSAPLRLSGLPIRGDVEEGAQEVTLDRLVLDLVEGQAIALSGKRADAPDVEADEIALIEAVHHVGGVTRLQFAAGVQNGYVRSGLRVNGNVALASHGARVEQILGSGDAARANQAFALMKTPLTFVPSDDPTGRASTLVVRVGGVAWAERSALYGAGPEDRVFTLRIDDDGTTRVVFGDGIEGARLPTGEFNVTAEYRAGSGPEGETAEGTLIQMPKRPLGIRSVRNPDHAGGASAPETLDMARETAPTTVRTLDRVVSFTDYADAARRYPGIGKARADLVWLGERQAVVLTVGTESGAAPLPADPILSALRGSLDAQRDPALPLEILGYAPRYLEITLRVGFARNRRREDVAEAVTAGLLARYAFDAQPFADAVTGADIITVVQNTPGVVFVDLDLLRALPEGTTAPAAGAAGGALTTDLLPARPGRFDAPSNSYLAAELWLLSRAGLTLQMEEADAH